MNMTNFERLVEVLKKTFPGTNFCFEELHDYLEDCGGLKCDGIPCDKCKNTDFWMQNYEIVPCIPEEKPVYRVGYKIMVDDEGNAIPYSGTIHPTFEHAMDEMDDAEYHGWCCEIEKVYFTEERKVIE